MGDVFHSELLSYQRAFPLFVGYISLYIHIYIYILKKSICPLCPNYISIIPSLFSDLNIIHYIHIISHYTPQISVSPLYFMIFPYMTPIREQIIPSQCIHMSILYAHSTMKYSYYPYFQIISIDFQHFHRLILSIFPCDIHHLSPFFFPPRDGAGALVT